MVPLEALETLTCLEQVGKCLLRARLCEAEAAACLQEGGPAELLGRRLRGVQARQGFLRRLKVTLLDQRIDERCGVPGPPIGRPAGELLLQRPATVLLRLAQATQSKSGERTRKCEVRGQVCRATLLADLHEL